MSTQGQSTHSNNPNKSVPNNPNATGFVLFAQANLQKKPEATAEIANYINVAMQNYDIGKKLGKIKPKSKEGGTPRNQGKTKHTRRDQRDPSGYTSPHPH